MKGAEILITDRPIAPETVRKLPDTWFGDLVKIVVDVERRVVAVGGQLHADQRRWLLEEGSR